jgi:hypothetical protein
MSSESRVQRFEREAQLRNDELPRSGDLSREVAGALRVVLKDFEGIAGSTGTGPEADGPADSVGRIHFERSESQVTVILYRPGLQVGGWFYRVGLPSYEILEREVMR